jgi:hypothetical protein
MLGFLVLPKTAIIASYRYYLIYFVLWTLYSNSVRNAMAEICAGKKLKKKQLYTDLF